MDRQYRNKFPVDYEFNEVDRFLQNSSNNVDFWCVSSPPAYHQREPLPTKDIIYNKSAAGPSYSDMRRDVPPPSRSILYHENNVINFS